MRNYQIVYSTIDGTEQPAWESPLEPGVFLFPPNTTDTAPPEYDINTQRVYFQDNKWVVEPLPEKPPMSLEEVKERRFLAYLREADPLFFKWQRGECDKEDYLNKIEEIRQRFPKPIEDKQ